MTKLSTITDKRITESSSLARSVFQKASGWTVIDEAVNPMLFRVEFKSGRVKAAIRLDYLPKDCEAVAINPSTKTLGLGDIGDNDENRKDCAILLLPEPTVSGNPKEPYPVNRVPFRYGDGKSRDAETLLWNPKTHQWQIISKQPVSKMYELRFNEQDQLIAYAMPGSFPSFVTDGEYSPKGDFLALRAKHQRYVFIYDMRPTTPKYLKKIKTETLAQPESICLSSDDKGVIVGSEGRNSGLYFEAMPSWFARN